MRVDAKSPEVECSKSVPGLEQLAKFNNHSRPGSMFSPVTDNHFPRALSAQEVTAKPMQAAFDSLLTLYLLASKAFYPKA